MYKLAYDDKLMSKGFYRTDIHSSIPNPCISITKELWEHLMTLGDFKISEEAVLDDVTVYTIEDKDMFILIPPTPMETDPDVVPVEERLETLEQENADLLLGSVQQSIRMDTLEQDVADLMFEMATRKGEI